MERAGRWIVLLVLGALAPTGCGTGEHRIEGDFVVEPQGTTEVVVTGTQRTQLQLDGRGGGPVQMESDDGETEAFGHDTRWRKAFTGTLTLIFRNATQDPARIHYRATSPEGVAFQATQR